MREAGRYQTLARVAEGVAILRSADIKTWLKRFCDSWPKRSGSQPMPAEPTNETDPDVETLVADLLGATLVDAQDELWAAWAALERAGYPATALKWMTEPPPWPPASVAKILDRPGEEAMTLIETLAARSLRSRRHEPGWCEAGSRLRGSSTTRS